MAIKRATVREQKVFDYWLDNLVRQKRGLSATDFLRLCKDNKGPKELNELYHPGSDTVTGEGSAPSTQRDANGAEPQTPNPSNAAEQLGPASSQDETSGEASGTASGFRSPHTGYA